jgi:hypothetical protein
VFFVENITMRPSTKKVENHCSRACGVLDNKDVFLEDLF